MAGTLVIRLIAIIFGLLLAWLAAGTFLAAGIYAGFFQDFFASLDLTRNEVDMFTIAVVSLVGAVQGVLLASQAFAPSATVIALAEAMRWRGLTINLLMGGFAAIVTGWLALRGQQTQPMTQGAAIALLSTGFAGGFVYWLVAGRNAGRWLD